MIVNQVHVDGHTVLKTEDYPPIAGYTNAPLTGTVASQCV